MSFFDQSPQDNEPGSEYCFAPVPVEEGAEMACSRGEEGEEEGCGGVVPTSLLLRTDFE